MGAGIRALEADQLEAARAAFRRAHRAFPGASAVRGLGLAAFKAGNYRDAIDCLEAALASPNQPLPAAIREATTVLLDQARAFFGSYELVLVPKPVDVRLAIDGIPSPWDGQAPVVLAPGRHQLQVQAPGYREWNVQLVVVAGERGTFEVRMAPGVVPPEQSAAGTEAAKTLGTAGEAPREAGVDGSVADPDPAPRLRVRVGVSFGARGGFELSRGEERETQRLAPAFAGMALLEWPLLSFLTVGAGFMATSWTAEYFQLLDVGRHWLVDLPLQISFRHVWPQLAIGGLELYLGPTLGPTLNRFSSDLGVRSRQHFSGGLGYHLGVRAGAYWFWTQPVGLTVEFGYLVHAFSHHATDLEGEGATDLHVWTGQLVLTLAAVLRL